MEASAVNFSKLLLKNCPIYNKVKVCNHQNCITVSVSVMGTGASKAINMNSAAAEFVKATISSDTVVIFSKTYCPYCKMAKEVFNNLKHKYTLIELDQREDGSEMQDVLGELTGARSVPRVFVKGKFVGGGTDVQALYNKGELQLMLAA